MIVAGIELGISNSKIGIFKNDKAYIVPNSMGDSCTPSIVTILDDIEAVGEETMMHRADEKHTITEIKRLIGKNINDLNDLKGIKYDISSKNDKLKIKINLNGNDEFFSPEQIISLIFKKLIKSATDFTETIVNKAVITVPTYFNDKQIDSIEESAKLAGIEILEIINEPTAAALAYGFGTKGNIKDSFLTSVINKNSNFKKVLVFDLGGGSLDVSVLIIENNNISVKATCNDNFLGGIYFDNKLIDFCIHDFCQKMNIDEKEVRKDSKALNRLKIQCEKGKKKLSSFESTNINVYNFYDGLDFYININRERFNELCEDLYQRIKIIVDKVLTDSSFNKDEIDDIILAGGSTKIPKIKEIIEQKFEPQKIRDVINQDEVVALGASWKAHKLAKKKTSTKYYELLPASISIGMISKIHEERVIGQIKSVLIKKDYKLPAKSETKEFKSIKDNQEFFKLKIYYGEDKFVKNNKLLKEFIIDNLPLGKAGSVSFSIFIEIDNNGIITINVEVKSIGKKIKEQISIDNIENTDNKPNNENSNTIISLNKNPQLIEIKKNVKIINEKNNSLKSIKNNEEKLVYLNELCDACSKIKNIYESLKRDNDSEKLYEKIFDYTKLLFKYYSQMIIIDKEDKSKCSDIISKIKEEMPKYKNENIEILLEAFIELKSEEPKQYIEIILFCTELLYQEGDKILEERKKNARYYSKKFYQKAETIKKYIDEDLKNKMDFKLSIKFQDIEKKYGAKVAEIDSFVKIIQDQIKQKNTPYLPKKSGFTAIQKMLQSEDMYFTVDILQEMSDSLSKGEPSEVEAYIKANIIKINFTIFKNYDFKLYEALNKRIEFIYDRLDIDDDSEPDWHKQLMEINEEIEKKKDEIENKKKQEDEENKNAIKNINRIFNEKIEENKPLDFIAYIIDNYPYINFESSKKDELMQNSFQEVFRIIFPKYHPDNYKDKDNFIICNEIYIILVKMEEKYIKMSNCD